MPRSTNQPAPMPARTLVIELIPIGDLIPDPTNARVHSEKQLSALAANMREFGPINPVLIDEANGMLAGHGRLRAALMNGITHLPCIRITGLTARQKKALAGTVKLTRIWFVGLPVCCKQLHRQRS